MRVWLLKAWKDFKCRMGWHKPSLYGPYGFDGCSSTSVCHWCEKAILQDSQGNWFTASYKEPEQ